MYPLIWHFGMNYFSYCKVSYDKCLKKLVLVYAIVLDVFSDNIHEAMFSIANINKPLIK